MCQRWCFHIFSFHSYVDSVLAMYLFPFYSLENQGSKHVDLSKDYLASTYDSTIWSFSTKCICLSMEVAVFVHLSDGNKMV